MAQVSNEAPGHLELVRTFVNSRNPQTGVVDDWDPELGEEALSDPETARRWLIDKGLLVRGSTLSAKELADLVEFREALRSLLRANNGGGAAAAATDTVNRLAGRTPVTISMTKAGQAELSSTEGGVQGLIGKLLGIATVSINSGTWPRLKACAAEDCGWAFYDHSRNRSGTWCEMATCGNRAKARSFRRRHHR
jgi:predicted RNA-binding Zn ribbon-like protein